MTKMIFIGKFIHICKMKKICYNEIVRGDEKMSLKQTYEFDQIVNDIIENDKFKELKHELHHGISRYEHSMRVAKITYRISKKCNLDYERITRAALLHDFFTDEDTVEYNTKETLKKHPMVASINAKKYFDIDTMQENIIETHMFPITKELPKYAGSWVVTSADKLVAAHEMYRYKAQMAIGIWLIFIFNIIAIQK